MKHHLFYWGTIVAGLGIIVGAAIEVPALMFVSLFVYLAGMAIWGLLT